MEARSGSVWIEEAESFCIESRGTKRRTKRASIATRRKENTWFVSVRERERGVCKRRDAKEAASVSEVHEVKNAALATTKGKPPAERETRGSLLKRDPRARISLYECIHAARVGGA